ncbi:hypothetical protein [Caenimonas sp. SL110]|uniref:hypothetical protein n=1 Tax=Caenimonas sp. SL110 TaxID=1450524 RepID=UPI0006532A91|nr:hypothetical protein [Caenimonas sp. SL110]
MKRLNFAAAPIAAVTILMCGAMVAACKPSEQRVAQDVERKRIECLDKPCEGDTTPTFNPTREQLIKLNGQWFVAPKAYVKGFAGLAFYWPSKTPLIGRDDGTDYPEKSRDYYDVAIEIFLTGRQRWPDPRAEKPWEGKGWDGRFEELRKQGLRIEREMLRPELERVRFFDAQGKQYRHEYFLATTQRKTLGDGVPGVACDLPDPRPKALPRCTGGVFWQEDVYADFRFHAKHAVDWPAINQEIVRVLNLAKKVQP